MGILRRLSPHRPQQIDLARRVIDMVVAANDMGNPHVPIIHHHSQVVSGRTISTLDDKVIQLGVAEGQLASHQILKSHHPFGRVTETDDMRFIRVNELVAAVAVISRLLLALHLLLAQCLQPLLGTVAAVGITALEQLLDNLIVALKTLCLVERTLVVLQPQPGHPLEDRVDRLLR